MTYPSLLDAEDFDGRLLPMAYWGESEERFYTAAEMLNEAETPPPPSIMIMLGRLAAMESPVKFTAMALAMIVLQVDRPGTAVLWAWTLHKMGGDITYDRVREAFPRGWPTEAEQWRIWDSQKVIRDGFGSDNALDYKHTWEVDDESADER